MGDRTPAQAYAQKPVKETAEKEAERYVKMFDYVDKTLNDKPVLKRLSDNLRATTFVTSQRNEVRELYKTYAKGAGVEATEKIGGEKVEPKRILLDWPQLLPWGEYVTTANFKIANWQVVYLEREKDAEMRVFPLPMKLSNDELTLRMQKASDPVFTSMARDIISISEGKAATGGPFWITLEQYRNFWLEMIAKDPGPGKILEGQILHLAPTGGRSVYVSFGGGIGLMASQPEGIYKVYYDMFTYALDSQGLKNKLKGDKPFTVQLDVPESEQNLMQQSIERVGYGVRKLSTAPAVFEIDPRKLQDEAKRIATMQLVYLANAIGSKENNDVKGLLDALNVLQRHLQDARQHFNWQYGTELYNRVAQMRSNPRAFEIKVTPKVEQVVKQAGNSLEKTMDIVDKKRAAEAATKIESERVVTSSEAEKMAATFLRLQKERSAKLVKAEKKPVKEAVKEAAPISLTLTEKQTKKILKLELVKEAVEDFSKELSFIAPGPKTSDSPEDREAFLKALDIKKPAGTYVFDIKIGKKGEETAMGVILSPTSVKIAKK
jgi:hypothetical protein